MAFSITRVVTTKALEAFITKNFKDRVLTVSQIHENVPLDEKLNPERAAAMASDYYLITGDLPWEGLTIRRMRERELEPLRSQLVSRPDDFLPAIYEIRHST